MVEEQRIEERAQAVRRLRSLFDMHKVVYGAPVNLRGMLLNLHHDRHFSMEFWSVVNTFSEGAGGGSLTEEQMFEAILESVTGVTSGTMPPYERPAVVELGQMLGGIDLERPTEESLEPVLPPVPSNIVPQQGMVAGHPASADLRASESSDDLRAPEVSDEDGEEGTERRRSIADALARLEQTTRELREQLAQMEGGAEAPVEVQPLAEPAVFAASEPVAPAPPPVAAAPSEPAPAAEVIRERLPISEPVTPPVAPPVGAVTEADEEEDEQSASPMAEAHPPHRFIDVIRPDPRTTARNPAPTRPEPVITPRTPRVPLTEVDPFEPGPLSSPLEQIRPPAAAASAAAPASAPPVAAPVPPAAPAPRAASRPAPAPAGPPVFEPRPAHTLSQRGLAIPPPLDENEINANPPSFGRYGEEPESSSKTGLAVTVALLVLLGAGAWAGVATEQGREIVSIARQWLHDTYNSVISHSENSSSEPAPEPQPAAANTTAPAQTATPASTEATNPAPSASQATTPTAAASTPPPARTIQPAEANSETPRTPRRQPFVDDSVLRVSSSMMAGNLVSSRAPVYPPAALSQEVEGVVNLDVVVGSNGLVKFAKAIDGDRLLQSAAEEAVLRWRYKPYVLNGEPVSVSTTVQVRFRLPQE